MYKRTKGYILLTMLVLTGLAGRIHTDALRSKERKLLVTQIKSDRNALLDEIKRLSMKQFYFKINGTSIKKCVQEQINYENDIWMACKDQLSKQVIVLSDKHAVTDAEFQHLLLTGGIDFDLHTSHYKIIKTQKEEITALKNLKDEELKFARTTTDNLHKYTLQTNCGTLDIYQVLLLTSTITKNTLQQIQSIRSSQHFPK